MIDIKRIEENPAKIKESNREIRRIWYEWNNENNFR